MVLISEADMGDLGLRSSLSNTTESHRGVHQIVHQNFALGWRLARQCKFFWEGRRR
jgi:hypothetical protein